MFLQPHGRKHASLPCLSLSLRICSNSCPLSQWCHPTISSSVVPFSSCLQSFPGLRSFQMSQLFASGGQKYWDFTFYCYFRGLIVYIIVIIFSEDWCWSWNSNTSPTWCEELTHWKRPWSWERLKAGGEGDDRGWDGRMASPTQWTLVWVNSGSWWWTGRPAVLQSMGSQRVRHDWVTELNWTEYVTLET